MMNMIDMYMMMMIIMASSIAPVSATGRRTWGVCVVEIEPALLIDCGRICNRLCPEKLKIPSPLAKRRRVSVRTTWSADHRLCTGPCFIRSSEIQDGDSLLRALKNRIPSLKTEW